MFNDFVLRYYSTVFSYLPVTPNLVAAYGTMLAAQVNAATEEVATMWPSLRFFMAGKNARTIYKKQETINYYKTKIIQSTSRYIGIWICIFLYIVYDCFYTCQVDIFFMEDLRGRNSHPVTLIMLRNNHTYTHTFIQTFCTMYVYIYIILNLLYKYYFKIILPTPV